MNIIGLIVEYNPFHNGHLYQIETIKELYPDSLIICVLSTCFCQRGEISVLNKWDKTSIALKNNIDLVIELPYFFTTQSADIFAHASLQILNEFKIDTLVFGSEINDISILKNLAFNSLDHKYEKKFTKKGFNYPRILAETNNTINSPNDILALSYIKEIIKNNYNINPVSIKRTNNYHDNLLDENIVSALNIRDKYYKDIDIKKYVPTCTYQILRNKNINFSKYLELLKYKVITEANSIANYLDVDEGLDNKINNIILKCSNIDECIKMIKSKRYTYNRISRMLNHILVGLNKDDAAEIKNIEYLKILGFNTIGRQYLNSIKKNINYPIIYNYKKEYKVSNYELTSTKIYSIITSDVELVDKEYKKNVIINK